MLKHEHLLVSANVSNPIIKSKEAKQWLEELVAAIGMKVLAGPWAKNCKEPGNEGISATILLTTSHAVIHIWPRETPARIELDVYSCADIDLKAIWKHMKVMEPTNMKYKFLDRSRAFKSLRK